MTSINRWILHYVALVVLALALISHLRADDSEGTAFEGTEFVATEGESDVFILRSPRYAGVAINAGSDPATICSILGHTSYVAGSLEQTNPHKDTDPFSLALKDAKIEAIVPEGVYNDDIVSQIICLGKTPRSFPGDKIDDVTAPTLVASHGGETTENLHYSALSDPLGVCIRLGYKGAQAAILLKIERNVGPAIAVDKKGSIVSSENDGYRIAKMQCISPKST